MDLERRRMEVTYVRTPGGYEVDFLARRPGEEPELIQVCADWGTAEVAERELRALDSMQRLLNAVAAAKEVEELEVRLVVLGVEHTHSRGEKAPPSTTLTRSLSHGGFISAVLGNRHEAEQMTERLCLACASSILPQHQAPLPATCLTAALLAKWARESSVSRKAYDTLAQFLFTP